MTVSQGAIFCFLKKRMCTTVPALLSQRNLPNLNICIKKNVTRKCNLSLKEVLPARTVLRDHQEVVGTDIKQVEKHMGCEYGVYGSQRFTEHQGNFISGVQPAFKVWKCASIFNENRCTSACVHTLCSSVIYNTLLNTVILRKLCQQTSSFSTNRHFSKLCDTTSGTSDVGKPDDMESWEMMVNYSRLSPTEMKIHERHRNAVKV